MLAAPRIRPTPQSRRMVDRAAIAVAQDARPRRAPHRLSDCARCGTSHPRHLQDRARIHRRLDCAALSDRPGGSRAAFCRIGVGSVNPTTLARAGYWQGRAAEAAGRAQEARTAYTSAAAQSTSYYGQLARAKLGLPQIELSDPPPGRTRGLERLEIVRAVQLLYQLEEGEIAVPIFADMGENGDPDALVGSARRLPVTATHAACCWSARPR